MTAAIESYPFVIIGAGAAGLFTASLLAQAGFGSSCLLLEKTRQPAAKIRISGGGRCNLTHACFDPQQLVQNYPRGQRELRGPMRRFQPHDTIRWFQSRGVELISEDDGRVFPSTHSSETIANCLLQSCKEGGVTLRLQSGVEGVERHGEGFLLTTAQGSLLASALLIATGSHPSGWQLAQQLGHRCIPPVPSLFSFHLEPFELLAHAGVTLPAKVQLPDHPVPPQQGELLITHTGFSGPAILRLSAWAARELHQSGYRTTLRVDWLPQLTHRLLIEQLGQLKRDEPHATFASSRLVPLPRQLLKTFCQLAELPSHQPIAQMSDAKLRRFIEQLKASSYTICGQSSHKQEFVTCGGVRLEEIDFHRFESKSQPGLFFAGEVLDIDAVTGGFNFQNAWTGAWHVASAVIQRLHTHAAQSPTGLFKELQICE